MTTNTLTYPISPDYVKAGHGGTGWNAERAIAEFIANALDEDVNAKVTYAGGTLTIEDNGPGIPEEGLLLGYSPKGDEQIGQFGEGSKIGALVLARDPQIGDIRIETVGYGFTPVVERRRVLDGIAPRRNDEAPEVLVYNLFSTTRERGTKVTIDVPKKIANAAMARFRHLSEANYTAPKTAQVILDGKGRVYIGGVYVTTKKNLRASYDLPLGDAKTAQNRDRTVIDSSVLNRLVIEALAGCIDVTVHRAFTTAALAGENITETEAYFAWVTDPRVKAMFRQIAAEEFGDQPTYYLLPGQEEAALAMTDKNGRQVSAEGVSGQAARMHLMALLGVEAARAARQTMAVREKTGTTYVALTKLSKGERANLDAAMTAVTTLFGPDAMGNVKVYGETNAYLECTHGFYSPSNGTISLNREILTDAHRTLEVLLHEVAHRMAHRKGGEYSDRTRGYDAQLVAMLTYTVQALTSNPQPQTAEFGDASDLNVPHQDALVAAGLVADVPEERVVLAKVLTERAPAAQEKYGVKTPGQVLARVGRHTGNWRLLTVTRPAGWRNRSAMSPSLIADFRAHEVIAEAFDLPAYALWLAHMACEAPNYAKAKHNTKAQWSGGAITASGLACADALAADGHDDDAALLRSLVAGEGDQSALRDMALRHITATADQFVTADA